MEFEAETLKDASGVLYPFLLIMGGVPDLCSRKNLEAVVGKMLSAGL